MGDFGSGANLLRNRQPLSTASAPEAPAFDGSNLPPLSNHGQRVDSWDCFLLPHLTAADDVSAPSFQPLQQRGDDLSTLGGDIDIDTDLVDLDIDGFAPPQTQTVVDSSELGPEWMFHSDDLDELLPRGAEDEESQYQLPDGGPNQAPDAGPEQACALSLEMMMPPDPAAADVPALDEMTVDDMVRVAEECGEDQGTRAVWSNEEHKELLRRLHEYADVRDDVMRCFLVAFHLPKKTAMDVALRWRWLQDKEKAAKQTELLQKDAGAITTVKKGRGTNKAAKKKSDKIRQLSKEAIDSKSTKDLIRDNHILLQKIEEKIKTGELDESADYFHYVKINMDAITERENKFCNMRIPTPPVDEQALEGIPQRSRTRHNISAEDEKRRINDQVSRWIGVPQGRRNRAGDALQ